MAVCSCVYSDKEQDKKVLIQMSLGCECPVHSKPASSRFKFETVNYTFPTITSPLAKVANLPVCKPD